MGTPIAPINGVCMFELMKDTIGRRFPLVLATVVVVVVVVVVVFAANIVCVLACNLSFFFVARVFIAIGICMAESPWFP